MSTNSQYLNGQFSEAQIEQLRPVENYMLNEEKNVNKENMASCTEILKDDDKEDENSNSNTSSEKVKPVFLKDNVFGSSMKPARSFWLTKCRDIQSNWSKGTLTMYKGYTEY